MTISLVQSFKELENDKQNLASRGRHRGAVLCCLSDRWLTLLSPGLCRTQGHAETWQAPLDSQCRGGINRPTGKL